MINFIITPVFTSLNLSFSKKCITYLTDMLTVAGKRFSVSQRLFGSNSYTFFVTLRFCLYNDTECLLIYNVCLLYTSPAFVHLSIFFRIRWCFISSSWSSLSHFTNLSLYKSIMLNFTPKLLYLLGKHFCIRLSFIKIKWKMWLLKLIASVKARNNLNKVKHK